MEIVGTQQIECGKPNNKPAICRWSNTIHFLARWLTVGFTHYRGFTDTQPSTTLEYVDKVWPRAWENYALRHNYNALSLFLLRRHM